MRRPLAIAVIAAAIIGVWWALEDGGLGERLTTIGPDSRGPGWGDVADKVGEFSREERDLRETIGRLGPGNGEGTDETTTE